jgi:hypothetical protein
LSPLPTIIFVNTFAKTEAVTKKVDKLSEKLCRHGGVSVVLLCNVDFQNVDRQNVDLIVIMFTLHIIPPPYNRLLELVMPSMYYWVRSA